MISVKIVLLLVLAFSLAFYLLYKRGNRILMGNVDEMIKLIKDDRTMSENIEDLKEYCRMHRGIPFGMMYLVFDKIAEYLRKE